MSSGGRFWCIALILGSATAGFRLIPHGREVHLAKPLASLPFNIGQWHGVDIPIDARQLRGAAVDDYVSRDYRAQNGPPIALYIGYYKSQRTGESIHSPQNCLPGSGWQPLSTRPLVLNVAKRPPVVVNEYLVQKGIDRQLVIYWYQSSRRAEASELHARFNLVVDAIRLQRTDSALVRINTPLAGRDTDEQVEKFATAILATMDGFLP